MRELLALTLMGLLATGCTITTSDNIDDDDDSSLFDEEDPFADTGDGDQGDGDTGDGDAGDGDAMADPPATNSIGGPRPSQVLNGMKPEDPPTGTDATSVGLHGLNTDTEQEGDMGDDYWIIMTDLDDDGVEDRVLVVFDDETDDLYFEYTTVIEDWCTDGSDGNADVLEVYYESRSVDVVLWETDCQEDAGIVFGCDLDSQGQPTDNCGVCDQRDGVWICETPDEPAGDGDGDTDPDTMVDPDDPDRCSIDASPELAGVNLSMCELPMSELSFADLSGANLTGANLSSANLAGADLARADMTDANLQATDFTSADMEDSILHGADLRDAILTDALLWRTELDGADLRGANLNNADLTDALIYNANLRNASMSGTTITGAAWRNTTCPDGTNSDNHGDTCMGHL